MTSIWETVEAMRPGNGRGNTSHEGETHPLTAADLTNLLLLELLQKQNEQIQRQSKHLQLLAKAREKGRIKDNSHMFKTLANHNPPMYNSVTNLKAFEDWIRGMKKLFDALQCPED